MELKKLTLRHFRNYTYATFVFAPGINVIQGPNGTGKTSLLEAIYLFSTGRSFRTPHLSDLIQHGHRTFHIEAHFEKEGVLQSLSIQFSEAKRTIYHNASKQQATSDLLGLFPSVLYAPKDGALIIGSPSDRRRFLNIQLAQTHPRYTYHLIRYHKALKQRNALLKMTSLDAVSSWERVMAQSGCYLIEERQRLIQDLQPKLTAHGAALCPGDEAFDIHYKPSIPITKESDQPLWRQLFTRFEQHRPKESVLGTTLFGPHRDDFFILHRNQDAKAYASEGQKRSCIAALKMAEWDQLTTQARCAPIFSIDDFDIHLDSKRRKNFSAQLTRFGQVFLTTPASCLQDVHLLTLPQQEK